MNSICRIIVAVAVIGACLMTPASSMEVVGRSLKQLGGGGQTGNLVDNCSGYSTEQLLNFLAGVIGGSTTPPSQLLVDSTPTNCPNGAGRRLLLHRYGRKLHQLNKICSGISCLEAAVSSKYGGVNTAGVNSATATITGLCSNQIDGTGTETLGQVTGIFFTAIPQLAATDATIAAMLQPFCTNAPGSTGGAPAPPGTGKAADPGKTAGGTGAGAGKAAGGVGPAGGKAGGVAAPGGKAGKAG